MIIHVLLILLALITGVTSDLLNNISLEGKGYEDTTIISEFPHAGILEIGEIRPALCGASLIMVQVIITAATCLTDMRQKGSKVFAYFGHEIPKKSKCIRRVVNAKNHDNYHAYSPLEKNNLAVAFLDERVTLGKFIKKIPLIYFNLNRDTGYGVGWIKDKSIRNKYRMKRIDVRVMSMKECEHKVGHYLRHSVMCSISYPRYFDRNDAGTGLMYYKSSRNSVSYLAGVLSHIIDGVAVYAIIFKERNWITRTSIRLFEEYCRHGRRWSGRRGITNKNVTCTSKYFYKTKDGGGRSLTIKNDTCIAKYSNETDDGVKISFQTAAAP